MGSGADRWEVYVLGAWGDGGGREGVGYGGYESGRIYGKIKVMTQTKEVGARDTEKERRNNAVKEMTMSIK